MLLGIDIGTSKIAAVIVDRAGAVCATVSRVHRADRACAPGLSEQDVSALLASAASLVRELPEPLLRSVGAIGVTGQMHGVTVLDRKAQPLTPLITWQDQRCEQTPDFLEDLRRRTGQRISTGFGCATLAWMITNGALPKGAASSCTIYDLLVARLCGKAEVTTDPTSAASWGFFDLKRLAWDDGALASAGIRRGLLPDVLPCGSRAGALSGAFATVLGLKQGIPVAAAIGDNQASLLAGVDDPSGDLSLTLGTGGQLSAIVPCAFLGWRTDPTLFEYRPFPGDRYALVAACLCGGAAWAWLMETIRNWTRDLQLPVPPVDQLYETMNDLARTATDSLELRPHFLGERHDPLLRGSIAGIDLTNFRLGKVCRALAKGIMENLRRMLPVEVMDGRRRLVCSGNAIRRNPFLQTMAGEVFGLPVLIAPAREEAATGAALNAASLLD